MSYVTDLGIKPPVNTEDEIFWREVRNAYEQVNTVTDRQIEVRRGMHEAHVACSGEFVIVAIQEVEPKQPTLQVP